MREVHIGKLIENKLGEIGITKAEFGRRINTSRQNVNTLIKKASLDSRQLLTISKVLNYNFFQHYTEQMDPKPPVAEKTVLNASLMISFPPQMQKELLQKVFGAGMPELFQNLGDGKEEEAQVQKVDPGEVEGEK